MTTTRQGHRHHGDTEPDWVADPPVPPRGMRPVLWWGLTPRTLAGAAAAITGFGAVALLLWLFLPRPEPVPVPENFLGTYAQSASEPAPDGPAPAPETAFVHVAGEVVTPGLVEVSAHARVAEAIELAGGPTPEADLAAINLAAVIQDGEQIYLPGHGEAPPAGVGPASGEPGAVNINTATEAQLQTLSGVGPVLAARIVAHREANGPFGGVDDLQQVSGIGPSLMSTLRSEITV